MTTARLSHGVLAKHLARSGTGFSAAEVHGVASGLLAIEIDRGNRLVAEVLPDVEEGDLLATECRGALERLLAETRAGLEDAALHFAPLLPGDDAPLAERVAALREWCEGFLYGFGIASGLPDELPPDAREALEDIGELTRLDTSGVGETEDEEQAYAELVEFVRVATLLIRDELHPRDARRAVRND